MAWTAPRTWALGELVTAAMMNAHVRDNELILKTPITDAGALVTASVVTALETAGNTGIGKASAAQQLDVAGDLRVGTATAATAAFIEIGPNSSGNRAAFIDFVGDATYTDFGLRLERGSTGANAVSKLDHRGTGSLLLRATDAADVEIQTQSLTRVTVASGGNTGINKPIPAQQLDVGGDLRVGTATAATAAFIEIGPSSSGNRAAFIDLVGDDTYTDYGLRLQRGATGANAISQLDHRGTGALLIRATDAGSVAIQTSAATRLTVDSAGLVAVGSHSPSTNLHIQESNTDTVPTLELEQLSTGDVALQLSIVGDAFAFGIDNTDDSLKISYSSTAGAAVLGTNDRFTLTPAGSFTFDLATNQSLNIANTTRTILGVDAGGVQAINFGFATENVVWSDAGSASATEQDWIQIIVGATTGYIRVFATK